MEHGPVDDIVAQWRRERPDLDMSPVEVIERITRLARMAETRGKRVLRRFDLSSWEYQVLATLRRTGPSYELSPTKLLDSLLVSSGAMTNRIDHLERAGLVERRPDPHDRRGVLVRLTPSGRERVDQVVTAYVASEREFLRGLSRPERGTLQDLLRKLLVSVLASPRADRGAGR